MSSLFML